MAATTHSGQNKIIPGITAAVEKKAPKKHSDYSILKSKKYKM